MLVWAGIKEKQTNVQNTLQRFVLTARPGKYRRVSSGSVALQEPDYDEDCEKFAPIDGSISATEMV